ncbi:hypothetical protein ABZ370_35115 [Streptomyces sp. NPDC005962]|uniref:hypothetical protein n=1 Tax=Streptomyces sp. NPDC005962 TaxID=3154466 RepID=UPI0033F700D3
MAYALATLASATALALSPSAAGAQVASDIGGRSYKDCYTADGWYEYETDGKGGDYPKYDTKGDLTVEQFLDCDSWVDKGIVQYSGKKWQGGAWATISWRQPESWKPVPGKIDYFLEFNDVRDIRFRVCNVHDGTVDGCGSIS